METDGYYIFDSKTNKVYTFYEEPKFSPDKQYIVSCFPDYHLLKINILDLINDRKLYYTLRGEETEIIEIKLRNFNGPNTKQLLLQLKQSLQFDDDYQKIEKSVRSIKLLIQ